MTDSDKLILELKHRYKLRYEKDLEDEMIILIIRMNELQVELKNEITKKSSPPLTNAKHYFYFGLGRGVRGLLFAIIILLIGAISVYIFK